MNKFTLKAIDEVKVFDMNKATIFTVPYNKRLKPNTLHTPNAAKIIIEDGNTISSFLLLQPIVNVLDSGDVEVHTSSTFDQATLKTKYREDSKDMKSVKREIKILENKFKLGISIDELINMNYSRSMYEIMILEDRVENEYKGGGF